MFSIKIIMIYLFALFSIHSLAAQNKKIIVGTKVAEPFVIINEAGKWSGISFDLWNKISEELNVDFEIKQFDLEGLTNAVKKGEIDIAVSPLTITSEREKDFDFTHSYFSTGLSIAVSNDTNNDFVNFAKNIFSIQFIKVIAFIFLALVVVSLLVWFFEKEKNKSEFGSEKFKGLGSSFWWAVVTMTTVGYGDKAPRTIGGRTVAIIWMFAGLIMISGFTAAVASVLTIEKLDVEINSLSDLHNSRVGTIKGSSSEEFLVQNGVNFITIKSIDECIEFIENNKIDAFIYDEPILKYFIKSQNISNKINILPIILDPIHYAFALPTNSPLREDINRILLREIDEVKWKETINSYIGF